MKKEELEKKLKEVINDIIVHSELYEKNKKEAHELIDKNKEYMVLTTTKVIGAMKGFTKVACFGALVDKMNDLEYEMLLSGLSFINKEKFIKTVKKVIKEI